MLDELTSGSLGPWVLGLTAAATIALALAVLAVRWVTMARRRRRARLRALVAPLVPALLDGQDVARPQGRAAIVALADLAVEMVHKVRGADRAQIAAWLTSHGYRDEALRAMRSRWAPTRAHGVELYLATTSGTEVGPVLELLADPHPRVRAAVVRSLGASAAREAVPALLGCVAAGPRAVPVSAAVMAIVHAAPSSAAALEAAWDHPDPRVVRTAAEVARHLALADARVPLERLVVAHPDPRVRSAAVAALGAFADPRSRRALEAGVAAGRGRREVAALRDALAALAPAGPSRSPVPSVPTGPAGSTDVGVGRRPS